MDTDKMVVILAICVVILASYLYAYEKQERLNIDLPSCVPGNQSIMPDSGWKAVPPGDWIHDTDFEVYDDKVVFNGDYKWSGLADTGSMRPTFDGQHNLILKTITGDCSRLDIGDIIVYSYNATEHDISHRIVGRDHDRFVVKGDDNQYEDNKNVSCENISMVVVGVLY